MAQPGAKSGDVSDSSAAAGYWVGKRVLVTGASRGLGLEFTRMLAERGAQVVATCRSPTTARALTELAASCERIRVAELDTCAPETAAALEIDAIDVLVNNAGIATAGHPVDPILESDGDELARLFAVNVAGTIATTNALLPALRRGRAKTVVMLSSQLGSIAKTFVAQSTEVRAGGVSSYRISKAALNMASRVFAAELAPEGFVVIALAPGWVATDMGCAGGRSPPLTPETSISGCADVIATRTSEHNGRFFAYTGAELPW